MIDAYHRAVALVAHVVTPPRTTWKGTPLHELWLTDPDGTPIEIYARLTMEEMIQKPVDQAPVYLVPAGGTAENASLIGHSGASFGFESALAQNPTADCIIPVAKHCTCVSIAIQSSLGRS
ncbi:MAG: hypothetical protein ACK4RZ_16280 [Paracoccaceae bacterium]